MGNYFNKLDFWQTLIVAMVGSQRLFHLKDFCKKSNVGASRFLEPQA
jgi:hypothetical protein